MEFNELNVAIDNATDEIIRIAIEQFMTEVWKMDWIRFGIDLQEEDNKYMYTATSGLFATKFFNYRHPMPKLSINKKTKRACPPCCFRLPCQIVSWI